MARAGGLVITLVIGGTRSGKSEVAERLAAQLPKPVTFVATGVAVDDDMHTRIERHRARRPRDWQTVECDDDLPSSLHAIEGTVLLDSLGTWVARRIDLAVDVDALVDALTSRDGSTVVVSEEVGLSVHPTTEAGRHFADSLGALNLAVAAHADDVILVVAGRPLQLPRADA